MGVIYIRVSNLIANKLTYIVICIPYLNFTFIAINESIKYFV